MCASVETGFEFIICGMVCKRHPVLTFYCCDILEGIEISVLKRRVTTRYCVRCIVARNDILHLKKGNLRDCRSTKQVYIESGKPDRQGRHLLELGY